MEHHLKTFNDLLYDSVYLLYFASDIDIEKYDDDVASPLIRASIMNSILLLECGANCLIDSLSLPSKFYDDIEKLPFLSKYEFFLQSKFQNKRFDRGVTQIQKIKELKTLRDFYVHPKVKKSKYERIGEHSWDASYGHTNTMQLPRDPSRWKIKHAIDALKGVNEFFNLYLLEWCEFNSDLVVDILFSEHPVNYNNPVGGYVDCVGGLDRAVKEWGIDFKFIGKLLV